MILLILFTTLVVYVCGKLYFQASKLPPGPFPIPILGNIFQFGWGLLFGKDVLQTMTGWTKTYGPVHTFWLGPMPTVNICDWSIAQEVMVKKGNLFVDRTAPFIFAQTRRKLGVVLSNGQHWSEQRRFALHSLRNFGLGRGIMEERIMLEVDYRCELLDKEITGNSGSLTFDPQHLLDITVGNVINRMLFGERFTEAREAKFFELKSKIDSMIEDSGITDMMVGEYTAKLPYFKNRVESFMRPHKELIQFYREQVAQKRAAIAAGEHELRGDGEDFVDAFLIQMEKSKEEGREDSFNDETLDITLLDLWTAGQETTSTTLYWGLSFLTLDPEVLATLEQEILSVTGGNRSLELNDKPNTPYLNAVITETLRMSAILPFNLVREAAEDTQIGDFMVPKGTIVTAQLSVILYDEKAFEDPYTFKPTRYLGENRFDQQVISFGLGKRACLGESLARAELYLMMGNFVLRYKISQCPEAMPKATARKDKPAMRAANPFKMTIRKRINN